MIPKTIVLWSQDDLLSSSVELFLANQKGWNVISISNEENYDELMLAVNRVNPDVVIIHQKDPNLYLNLPAILLHDHPKLKVVTLSLNNNLMEVYSKQDILVKSTSDLISVVDADLVN